MKNIAKVAFIVALVFFNGCKPAPLPYITEGDIGVYVSPVTILNSSHRSAVLSGVINNNNQELSLAGVYLSKTKEFTHYEAEISYQIAGVVVPSKDNIPVSVTVSNLLPDTRYYVKFYARISDKIKYGETISFKTLSLEEDDQSIIYDLPVIFHVIYDEPWNKVKNIPAEDLYAALESSNKMLNNTYKTKEGINTRIRLYPTPCDEKGVMLKEPGIFRIQNTQKVYDKDTFGSLKSTTKQMWDPNKVINIWTYAFDDKDASIIGQSYIGYTISTNPIGGLRYGDAYFNSAPGYGHGIQMSNRYIVNHETFSEALTHELGHYLGLYHTFTDEGCDVNNDYCDDTFAYDRQYYTKKFGVGNMLREECITHKLHKATNYMDYYTADFLGFSPDQIARMHHVLNNSPLVPGANKRAKTRSIQADLPIPEKRLM